MILDATLAPFSAYFASKNHLKSIPKGIEKTKGNETEKKTNKLERERAGTTEEDE